MVKSPSTFSFLGLNLFGMFCFELLFLVTSIVKNIPENIQLFRLGMGLRAVMELFLMAGF